LTNGAGTLVLAPAARLTGNAIGAAERVSRAAALELGVRASCCEPAVAGTLGANALGNDNSRAKSAAESFTGLGTGYTAGTDPKFAYV